MMVLTADGRVLVLGNNGNGQIGIGTETATTWTEVPLELGGKSTVKAVRAGPKTSFVIIENPGEVAEISDTEAEDEPGDGTSVIASVSEDVEMAGP